MFDNIDSDFNNGTTNESFSLDGSTDELSDIVSDKVRKVSYILN